jgi:hypothetical protein
MFEDDFRIASLAEHVPESLAKPSTAVYPLALTGAVCPMWRYTPMREVAAIDVSNCAQFFAIFATIIIRNNRNCPSAMHRGKLDSLGAKPARSTPD